MTRVANRRNRALGRLTLGAVATVAVAALAVPSALATPESDAADAINQAWDAAGGADSVLGGKDGEVYEVGAGYGQKFTGGKIFFTPAAGAHLMYQTPWFLKGAAIGEYHLCPIKLPLRLFAINS